MKRFLFLDDSPERHKAFSAILANANVRVVHVTTFFECVDTLQKNTAFDCCFLDHDLNDFGKHSISHGMYGSNELTGLDVAKFIVNTLPENQWPRRVVVHSHNPDGARNIAGLLIQYGINVLIKPFAV